MEQEKKKGIAAKRREAKLKTDIFVQQKAAYYSSLIGGFTSSRRDIDLNIMIISGGGIGLLVTLLTTQGQFTYILFVLAVTAMLLFVFSILHVLFVLHLDSKYMLLLRREEEEDTEEVMRDIKEMNERLKLHDRYVLVWFAAGIAFSFCFATFKALGLIHN